MILIPLAENCLKHCDFDLNPNAFVSMELLSNQKTIRFKTENSFSRSQQKSITSGVGLNNIRDRLELIYGEQFQFSTVKTDGIFKMNLEITWNR
jgi:LytS/YehU family sensor histidine kinase